MRDFVIVTDSDTEIPYWFADEHNIPVFLMPYAVDGEEELFDLGRHTDFKAFYDKLRQGAEATTATRPPQDIQNFFEEIIKTGKDVIYLCFSSQLSAHYDLALSAREQALANYPDARISIVDTLSIAMGAGLLVYHAVRLKEQGAQFDEIVQWVEDNKMNALHYFSVDDLMHLKRTGRLSAVTATLGSILDLKPILTLSKEGKVVAFEKVKGRRKVVKYFLDRIEQELTDDPAYRELCVVCHGDNLEQARLLEQEIKERFNFKQVWFMDVGPVIGCHTGPGVIALLFMGKPRQT